MRKQLQFLYFYLQAFLHRHKFQLIIGTIIGFLITLFVIQTYPLYVEFFGKKHQTIALVGLYNETNLPRQIQNQISLGLTGLTPAGEATPSLATNWEVDEKGTTYMFHIHQGIAWHDGKPFTVKDVNYKLEGAQFTPVDDYTLKITLKEPFAPLPVLLAVPIFRPGLKGVGIYQVQRITYNEDNISQLTLEPSEKNLPILTYKFYPTIADAMLAFKLGEVDAIHNLPSLEEVKGWNSLQTTPITQYDRFVAVFLNLKNPLFKEKEVRQALAYAIGPLEDRERVLTPISPLSPSYSRKIRLYTYDADAAQKILAKSELSSSSAQLTLSTFASLLPTAQMVADFWNKIGLNVKVKVEKSIPADYQMFILTQVIPSDPDQYHLWQSTQETTNISHYSNPKIDKLLEDGRRTLNKDERQTIYADFQRYLVDDAPVVFLYYPKVYNVERK